MIWFAAGCLLSLLVSSYLAINSVVDRPDCGFGFEYPNLDTLTGPGVSETSGWVLLEQENATREFLEQALRDNGDQRALEALPDLFVPPCRCMASYQIRESGWPLFNAYSIQWHFSAKALGQQSTPTPVDPNLERLQYFLSIPAPSFMGQYAQEHQVPIGVHVRNLLANSALTALALFAAWRATRFTTHRLLQAIRSRKPGHCPHCGYDATGLLRCPECGQPVKEG